MAEQRIPLHDLEVVSLVDEPVLIDWSSVRSYNHLYESARVLGDILTHCFSCNG